MGDGRRDTLLYVANIFFFYKEDTGQNDDL